MTGLGRSVLHITSRHVVRGYYEGPDISCWYGSIVIDANIGRIRFSANIGVTKGIRVLSGTNVMIYGSLWSGGDVDINGSMVVVEEITVVGNIIGGRDGSVMSVKRIWCKGDIDIGGWLVGLGDIWVSNNIITHGFLECDGDISAEKIHSYDSISALEGKLLAYHQINSSGDVCANYINVAGGELCSGGSIYAATEVVAFNVKALRNICAESITAIGEISAGGDHTTNSNDVGQICVNDIINGKIVRGTHNQRGFFKCKSLQVLDNRMVGCWKKAETLYIKAVDVVDGIYVGQDVSFWDGNIYISDKVQTIEFKTPVMITGSFVSAKADVICDSIFYVEGNVTINGNLTVIIDITVNGKLDVRGELICHANVRSDGGITTTRGVCVGSITTSTLSSMERIIVTGCATFGSDVICRDGIEVGGSLKTSGEIRAGLGVQVGGLLLAKHIIAGLQVDANMIIVDATIIAGSGTPMRRPLDEKDCIISAKELIGTMLHGTFVKKYNEEGYVVNVIPLYSGIKRYYNLIH